MAEKEKQPSEEEEKVGDTKVNPNHRNNTIAMIVIVVTVLIVAIALLVYFILKPSPEIEHIHTYDQWYSDAHHHWMVCPVCGDELDKASHDFLYYDEGEEGHNEVCEECGYTSLEDHEWVITDIISEATCTEDGEGTYECLDCGERKEDVIPALGHTFSEWTSIDNETHYRVCEVCGLYEEGAHELTYHNENESGHIASCAYCDYSELKEHNFSTSVTEPATGDTDGEIYHSCKDCGYFYKDSYPVSYSFETDSWDTISEISRLGLASQFYNIGDTRDITLTDDGVITVRIIGFDHDVLSDIEGQDIITDNGKAGITLEMVDCLDTTYAMEETQSNEGSWGDSYIRNAVLPYYYELLPDECKSVVKTVKKQVNEGNRSFDYTETEDTLFLLSIAEIYSREIIETVDWGNIYSIPSVLLQEGTQYEYYTDTIGDASPRKACNDLVKYINNYDGYSVPIPFSYWTRSVEMQDDTSFYYIHWTGEASGYYADKAYGVSFAFCV